MNLDCIAQVLIEEGLGTALGVDIFEHHMPETCTQGILLKLPIAGIPINHYIPGFFHGRFQAIYRSKDHAVGDVQSNLINAALTVTERTFLDIDGVTILMRLMQCYPNTLPVVYPRSLGNVFEWACNFSAQYIIL